MSNIYWNYCEKKMRSANFPRERSEPLSIINLTFVEPRSGSTLYACYVIINILYQLYLETFNFKLLQIFTHQSIKNIYVEMKELWIKC
jgi:hypothetical protein